VVMAEVKGKYLAQVPCLCCCWPSFKQVARRRQMCCLQSMHWVQVYLLPLANCRDETHYETEYWRTLTLYVALTFSAVLN